MKFTEKDFIYKKVDAFIQQPLSITKEAPSNIALVKYWGKYSGQIPMNPSVSFTLSKSKTITRAEITPKKTKDERLSFEFLFEGKPKPDFEPKIRHFLQNILKYTPFITDYHFVFDSRNTFPHSSGIASSASAFAALAKIIIDLEKQLTGHSQSEDFYLKKTSFLARIGSGSAARSIQAPVMIWGEHPDIPNSSNLYAIKPDFELHQNFINFRDSIVLVEKGQKKVSSTAGHALMENHIYKDIRKSQAFDRSKEILKILKNGDLKAFIYLTESEALNLHALMMTSQPDYLLMQPETLHIIHKIRNYRQDTGKPVAFTLDAGANVHILYPEKISAEIKNFLSTITDKEILEDYIKIS